MIKLQQVQLDRDIEWPGLGTSGSLLRAEDKWDLQRDEPWTLVSARRAGQLTGGRLIPASRCLFVEDAAAETAAILFPELPAQTGPLAPEPPSADEVALADAEALIEAKAQKQRARAARSA